jgi:hypothetical protein
MMVLPYDQESLLLVLQTDHSRVAGVLAAHWGNTEFAELRPYDSMVLAAQEHDGGWWDWEIKPTLGPDGRPLDYIGGGKTLGHVWLDLYRHGIGRVAEQDAYAGCIVSMHGEGLLTRAMGLRPTMPDRSADPGVPAFVDDQRSLRQKLRAQLQATDDEIWLNFKYMEVFDQMAQFICNRYPFNSVARANGPTPTLSDVPVPLRPGVADVTLTFDVQDEARAIVRPYPFDVDPLVISFSGRLVPNRAFADQADFLRHFYKAPSVPIVYSLVSP